MNTKLAEMFTKHMPTATKLIKWIAKEHGWIPKYLGRVAKPIERIAKYLGEHRRWRPTVDKLLFVLLAFQVLLMLLDRFSLVGFRRGDFRNVMIAMGAIAVAVAFGLIWFLGTVIVRRRFQFGIRSLLLLTIAVAMSCSMYSAWWREVGLQQEGLKGIQAVHDRILNANPRVARHTVGPAVDILPGPPEQVIGVSLTLENDWGQCIHNDVSDADLKHLAKLPKLQCLLASRTSISNGGLRHVAGLTNLRRLDLTHTRIGNEGLAHLASLENLERLSLRGTAVTDIGLASLSHLTSLRDLDLRETTITDEGLAHLGTLKNLEELRLSHEYIDGTGFEALAGSHLMMENPDVLSLSPAGVRAMSGLKNLRAVRTWIFDLDSEVGENPVAELRDLPNLTEATLLSTCPLEVANLANLKKLEVVAAKEVTLKDLPNLEDLFVGVGFHSSHNYITASTRCFRNGGGKHFARKSPIAETNKRDTRIRITGRSPRHLTVRSVHGTAVSVVDMPELEELTLFGHLHEMELANLPKLRKLHLDITTPEKSFRGKAIWTKGADWLTISNTPNLEKLQLYGLFQEVMISDIPSLESLRLFHWDTRPKIRRHPKEAGTAVVQRLPNLKRLDVHGRLKDVRVAGLPKLEHFYWRDGVTSLSIDSPSIDLPSLEEIVVCNKHNHAKRLKLSDLPSRRCRLSRPDESLDYNVDN